MPVKDIVDHARVAMELFSKEEIALRRDAFRPVLFALCRDAYRLGWSCWHRGHRMPPSCEGPVKVRAVGEYIIRDGDGRDISDEVVVERGHCWKCKRVTYQGVPIGEFMFGCPTPEDFMAPYTIELIEEWRSA